MWCSSHDMWYRCPYIDIPPVWDKIHPAIQMNMPKWRNWQTRYVQGVVSLRSWGFKSLLRHTKTRRCGSFLMDGTRVQLGRRRSVPSLQMDLMEIAKNLHSIRENWFIEAKTGLGWYNCTIKIRFLHLMRHEVSPTFVSFYASFAWKRRRFAGFSPQKD